MHLPLALRAIDRPPPCRPGARCHRRVITPFRRAPGCALLHSNGGVWPIGNWPFSAKGSWAGSPCHAFAPARPSGVPSAAGPTRMVARSAQLQHVPQKDDKLAPASQGATACFHTPCAIASNPRFETHRRIVAHQRGGVANRQPGFQCQEIMGWKPVPRGKNTAGWHWHGQCSSLPLLAARNCRKPPPRNPASAGHRPSRNVSRLGGTGTASVLPFLSLQHRIVGNRLRATRECRPSRNVSGRFPRARTGYSRARAGPWHLARAGPLSYPLASAAGDFTRRRFRPRGAARPVVRPTWE